jgi:hypothetical protein
MASMQPPDNRIPGPIPTPDPNAAPPPAAAPPPPYAMPYGVPAAAPGTLPPDGYGAVPPSQPLYPYGPPSMPYQPSAYPYGPPSMPYQPSPYGYAPPAPPSAAQPAQSKRRMTVLLAIGSGIVAAAILIGIVIGSSGVLNGLRLGVLGPSVPSISGTWQATDVYQEVDTLTLTQSGTSITGTTPDPAVITGTISGYNVSLTEHFTYGHQCYVFYTLTLSQTGTTMAGTARDPCGSISQFSITFSRL